MKGIYLITNKINGKKYVGMSNKISRRFCEHKSRSSIANKTTILYKAFRKYSICNFSFEILEIVESVDLLEEAEIRWISKLKPEYNMNKGGKGNKGYSLSEEMKMILSIAGKLQWESKSDYQKDALIKNNLKGPKIGHQVSNETRNKLRDINLGKKQSEQTKAKRSEKMKTSAIGNSNGNKKVFCLKDGNVIKTYSSIKEASELLKIHPSNITKVLKGVQKTAAGFC